MLSADRAAPGLQDVVDTTDVNGEVVLFLKSEQPGQDVVKGAAAGATGKPGAGDVVVYVEEVSGTGTIDFSITATYVAH